MISYFKNHSFKEHYQTIEIYNRETTALRCFQCKKNNVSNLSTCICGTNLLPNKKDSITLIIVKK